MMLLDDKLTSISEGNICNPFKDVSPSQCITLKLVTPFIGAY